ERRLGQGSQRRLTIAHDRHGMSLLLEYANRHHLIDAVVLSQQDAQGAVHSKPQRWDCGRHRTERLAWMVQAGYDGVPEFRLGDWLHQMEDNSQRPTMGGIA